MATSPGRERRSPAFVLALIAVALATVAGCRTVPWVNPPPEQVDQTWRNARPTPDAYPDTDSATIAGLDAAFRHGQAPPVAPGRPLEVLVLSGGGKYGAFTAGVLVGWTANGTRPLIPQWHRVLHRQPAGGRPGRLVRHGRARR